MSVTDKRVLVGAMLISVMAIDVTEISIVFTEGLGHGIIGPVDQAFD